MPTTSSPRSSSACTSVDPIKPAAPVTRTFIFCLCLPLAAGASNAAGPYVPLRHALAQLRAFLAVTARVHALPPPRVAAHVLEPVARLPAQSLFRKRGIRVRLGDVACPPSNAFNGDSPAARALECAHRLQH